MANYSDDNNNGVYTIFCSRCGNEYPSTARYCMKCGNLNPDHPQNKQYAKFINDHMEEYTVSSNPNQPVEVNKNEVRGGVVTIANGSNTGNFNTCFAINLLIYLGVILGSGLIFATLNGFDWRRIVSSNLHLIWIIYSIIHILLYSVELVFMKMNKPWWSGLIPFYHNAVLADCLYPRSFMGKFTVILPIPGIFILWYQMGVKFKKNGLLTALLPFVMFPIIGFGGSSFDDKCYVSGANSLEKEFKKKTQFVSLCALFLFLGGVMYGYSHFNELKEGGEKSAKVYMVTSSDIVISSLDKKIKAGKFACKNDKTTGTLYFYFNDISDPFNIPYGVFVETMRAVVRVEQGTTGNVYYISMTNGTEGFPETLSSNVNSDSIVEFTKLDESHRNVGCRITS